MSGGPVGVGATQLGAQREPAAEDVERLGAVAVAATMEEPAARAYAAFGARPERSPSSVPVNTANTGS
jgi:hypothetical protein